MKTSLLVAMWLLLISAHAQAQQHDHAGHTTPAACTPEHVAMGHCSASPDTAREPPRAHAGHGAPTCTPEHATIGGCAQPPATPSPETPHAPIPVLTDADRAAAFPVLHSQHSASPLYWLARFDRLETWDADPGSGQSWSVDAGFGGDIHRLRLASEGERRQRALESIAWHVHYSRSMTPWWDLLTGVRYDLKPDARAWASLGFQGLAPYFFELSAMLHAGSGGQMQLIMEAEYELRLTNRLILQPQIELTASRKNEPDSGIGSGLSRLETGLRLRYEITRRFAPYLGLVHARSLGPGAGFARGNAHWPRDTRVVAGVRVWF